MDLLDKSGAIMQSEELIPLVSMEDGGCNFLMKIGEDVEYRLEFDVYEVNSWGKNEESGIYNVPGDLELYLSGVIKWDGCSHVYFGEEDENGSVSGYLHLCGKEYWEKHYQVMREIYDYAEKTIKNYNPG